MVVASHDGGESGAVMVVNGDRRLDMAVMIITMVMAQSYSAAEGRRVAQHA